MRTDGAESWSLPLDELRAGFRDAALPRGSLSHEVPEALPFRSPTLAYPVA